MDDGADETVPALLAAGLVMVAVGVVLATFPAGLLFGWATAAAGAVLFIVIAVCALRAWRRRPPRQEGQDVDLQSRLYVQARLRDVVYVFTGLCIGASLVSLWMPSDSRWVTAIGAGVLAVVLLVPYLLMRRRNSRQSR